MELDPDLRIFRLSVDVRTFKAGMRLPMKAINAFVRVVLPPEIVQLANPGNSAKLTAPLRTHPPLMVHKGSEVALSNGYVALELPASVRGLAAALSQDPRLQAQVFHRDKYAADSLIGTASIPMASLMKVPWIDGYAHVYSPSDKMEQDGQVSIGTLRVVLSAEELGPVNKASHKPLQGMIAETKTVSPLPTLEDSFVLLKRSFEENLGSKGIGVQTESPDDYDEKPTKGPLKKKSERVDVLQDSRSKMLKPLKGNEENFLRNPVTNVNADRMQPEDNSRKYEMAWEFEKWRRNEEAKWRASLKEKEMKRMATLEGEWKQKEKERVLEIDKTRTELANLESKFRAKLFALEKRERAIVLAEEEASLRREALTRDCAQRAADAEVAVKRLHSECQHRVELERSKYTALKEQHSVLEKRLATANGALADLEKQFCTYKTEHRNTSEAELIGQVMVLKQQFVDLQRRCELAIRTKNDYKAQVRRMAKELAKLHRRHAQDEADRRAQDRGHLAIQSLIDAQARKNTEERTEIRQLKEQLERLQMHEQATVTAAASATVAPVSQNLRRDIGHSTVPPAPACCSSSEIVGNSKRLGSEGVKGLDEAIQVDLNTENASMADVGNRGVPVVTQERVGLDGWLADELAAGNMLYERSSMPLLEMGDKQDFRNFQLRTEIMLDEVMRLHSDYDEENKVFGPSPYSLQLSDFQSSEIKRLTKQKEDLLSTGVYTEEDRMIQGLVQEIQRLKSVDTKKFNI